MRDVTIPRSAASAHDLLQTGRSYDISDDVMLRSTSIHPDDLDDPIAEIAAADELRMIGNLRHALPDVPEIGLEAGDRCRPTSLGIVGLLLTSSATGHEMLAASHRYQDLGYPLPRVTLRRTATESILEIGLAEFAPDLRGFLVDHTIAALNGFGRRAGFARLVRRIELSGPRPPHGDRYQQLSGAPAVFGRAQDRVIYDNRALAQRLPHASPVASSQLAGYCSALAARRHRHRGMSGRVRARLEAAGTRRSLPAVADSLGTSARTLRRALAAEGTSFRQLTAEVMVAQAMHRLEVPDSTIEATARELGYATPSAFVQAFRRSTGHTPGEFRRHRSTHR